MKTFEKVWEVTAKIPKGKVMTYGQISKIIGTSPRVIGFALHGNKNPSVVPCHRVVFSNGSLTKEYAFGGKDVQKQLLEQEGVEFVDDKIYNLSNFLLK